MTMEELTKQLDVMDEKCEEAMLKVHNKEEGFMYYAQTLWDSMPHIPFKELPKEVQNRVLDSTNYDELFTFWEDCDFGADEVEISDEELRELLKKAVKVATYTITRDANGEIHADLYGDELTEAWSNAIKKYLTSKNHKQDPKSYETLMELQKLILPNEIVRVNTNVNKHIFWNLMKFDKPEPIKCGEFQKGKKKGDPAFAVAVISLRDLPEELKLSRDIEPYDDIVHTAITSLYENGNTKFTGQTIYRVITGNPDAIATPEALQKIQESWTRLNSTDVRLDTCTVSDSFGFERWSRKRKIIEGGTDTFTVHNQHGDFETTIYTVLEEPLLKTFANAINQIKRYPVKLLDTPINKTEEILLLQSMLMDHIQAIPRIDNHIVYDTLFAAINLTDKAQKQKRAKMRKYIHTMLDYWKEHDVIYRWSEEKRESLCTVS